MSLFGIVLIGVGIIAGKTAYSKSKLNSEYIKSIKPKETDNDLAKLISGIGMGFGFFDSLIQLGLYSMSLACTITGIILVKNDILIR